MDDRQFQRIVMEKMKTLKSTGKVTLADAGRVVDMIFESIWDECATDGEVRVAGIGKFVPAIRRERNGINPNTGKSVRHPEKVSIKFAMFGKARDRFMDDYRNPDYVNRNAEIMNRSCEVEDEGEN